MEGQLFLDELGPRAVSTDPAEPLLRNTPMPMVKKKVRSTPACQVGRCMTTTKCRIGTHGFYLGVEWIRQAVVCRTRRLEKATEPG